jgi:hypothetical protein
MWSEDIKLVVLILGSRNVKVQQEKEKMLLPVPFAMTLWVCTLCRMNRG